MKKLLAVLLAALLTVCCAVAETETLTDDDFSIVIPETAIVEVPELNVEAAATSSDIVSANGNMYTIVAEGLKCVVEENVYLGYLFTQDFRASFNNYDLFDISDAKNLQQALIDQEIHFLYLFSTGAEAQYCIAGADRASQKIGDLASIDADLFDLYASKVLAALGGEGMSYKVVKENGMTWMQVACGAVDLYITVAGGQYVIIYNYASGDIVSSNDTLDMIDLLSTVKITAAN